MREIILPLGQLEIVLPPGSRNWMRMVEKRGQQSLHLCALSEPPSLHLYVFLDNSFKRDCGREERAVELRVQPVQVVIV